MDTLVVSDQAHDRAQDGFDRRANPPSTPGCSLTLQPFVNEYAPHRDGLSLLPVDWPPEHIGTPLKTLRGPRISPAEHTSLHWTHNRACGFPAHGFPIGFTVRHTMVGRSLVSRDDTPARDVSSPYDMSFH